MKETKINFIGFIGLGVMGGSMCKNLLKNNQWDILINDLNPEKEKILENHGAKITRNTYFHPDLEASIFYHR